MIRLYEYEPRIDDDGNVTEGFRDFPNFLFSHPYGFLWDFAGDRVVIYGIAYRISSLRPIPDAGQVTCLCLCGGNGGSGGSGGGTVAGKIRTDVSLKGEGSDAQPLGVQLSERAGNRLQILDDGCYVGDEQVPYLPPTVTLSSNIPTGEYLRGETLAGMTLTVTVTAGSETVRDVRIFDGTKTVCVFDVVAGAHTCTFNLPAGVDRDVTFTASVSDGLEYLSDTLTCRFVLPLYCGVAGTMTAAETEILAATPLKVPGSSLEYRYASFKEKHLWMCCPESRVIKSISDENGFNITAAFQKTAVKLTLSGDEENYALYMFDTKTTGNHYQITFHF